MTIDDDNSIYVGGLPYDASEETLRRVFDLYGAVVAVKIINDRAVGGKCYGFVTFRNPRSAIDAINDMNGRTIGGRVVRVNEVKTRAGRTSFSRESFRHNNDRGMDWDRSRNRERDYDHDTGRYRDRDSDRSRERDRDRSREHDQEKGRGYEHGHDHDRARDHFLDRDQDDNEPEDSRDHDRNWERDLDWQQDKEIDGLDDQGYKDQQSKKRNGPSFDDRHGRGHSSDSSGDYYDQVKDQLERSIQMREDLQNEISQLEDKLEEKQHHVLDLQKKSLKLEDSLTTAKKLSLQRQMQLTKLHKCFLQVKDYSERLKSCEQELQSLVDTAMVEVDLSNDTGLRNAVLENGSV